MKANRQVIYQALTRPTGAPNAIPWLSAQHLPIWLRLLMSLPILAFATGCDLPAQIEWSPDGSSSAYCNGDQVMLLDEKGKFVAPFGNSTGGLAWSADSKHLYAAVYVDRPDTTQPATTQPAAQPNTTQSTSEATTQPATTKPATTQAASTQPDTTALIYDLHDGTHTTIATIPGEHIVYLRLSPDGRWLAVASMIDGNQKRTHANLGALSLATGKLTPISTQAIGTCFVGKDTLAFAEITDDSDHAMISEVKLSESAAPFKRRDLIQILSAGFGWMQNCDGDILFTQEPIALPQPIEHATPHTNLYRFNRSNHGLTSVMEDVGTMFAVSPDEKKILFEKDTWPEKEAESEATTEQSPATPVSSMDGNKASSKPTSAPTTEPAPRRELSVMNANGSNPHVLRVAESLPMWPAWHGNDEITFIDPAPLPAQGDDKRIRFNIVDYQLNDGGKLDPIRTLSEGWPAKMLPGDSPHQ